MPWTAAVIFGRPLFGPVAQRLTRKPSLTLAASPTRHKSVDVAKTYIRDADLWRDNVSGLVL